MLTLSNCYLALEFTSENGTVSRWLDFVEAFYQLDAITRKSGKDSLSVAELLPEFQKYLDSKLSIERPIAFGEAFQIYERVTEEFATLKKKLSVQSS